jgi:hypothetical protein
MALDDKELADEIYRFLARLSVFPVGDWGEEPRTREEVFRSHRFVFRLVIEDDGVDVTSLEEIVPPKR